MAPAEAPRRAQAAPRLDQVSPPASAPPPGSVSACRHRRRKQRHRAAAGSVVQTGAKTANGRAPLFDQVPSATHAATADSAIAAGTASALAPPEAVHLIGAPGEPGFENGAENGPAPTGFWKDHDCVVHLQGVVFASNLSIDFTLPRHFGRPRKSSRASPWAARRRGAPLSTPRGKSNSPPMAGEKTIGASTG